MSRTNETIADVKCEVRHNLGRASSPRTGTQLFFGAGGGGRTRPTHWKDGNCWF